MVLKLSLFPLFKSEIPPSKRDLINVTGYYKVQNNRPGKLTSGKGIKEGKSSFIKEINDLEYLRICCTLISS